jgi:hypothetical protein
VSEFKEHDTLNTTPKLVFFSVYHSGKHESEGVIRKTRGSVW